MALTSTNNILISYLYNEISSEEAIVLQQDLKSNWLLKEEYQMLREAYQALPKIKFAPKKATLQHILNYSASAPH